MFTAQQQSRKQEIIALFSQGTVDDKLFAELKQLNEAEKQAKVEREGDIAGLATSIGELQLSFAELMALKYENRPLFQSVDIMDYARGQGWAMPGQGKPATSKKEAGAPKKMKDGTLFVIQPPNTKGLATSIVKGDKFPQIFGAKFMWLAQQPGDLHENLLARAVQTPEVQQYLASEAGKAETKRWVDYIAEHAPKGDAKADAKADTTKKDGDKKEHADTKHAQTTKHK